MEESTQYLLTMVKRWIWMWHRLNDRSRDKS